MLLVLDAMTGQEAVNVAQAFHERIAFDGVILTKLDGDARGGAALSVKAVTGEADQVRLDRREARQLEVFHPDRMASRILGMGDVLTLIERAEAGGRRGRAGRDGEAHARRPVQFDDFLKRLQDAAPDGPAAGDPEDDPRHRQGQLGDVDVDENQLGRVEAIVLSMTPHERSLADRDRRQAPPEDRPRLGYDASSRSTSCSRRASRWRR